MANRLSSSAFDRIARALADPQRCSILERAATGGELCCSSMAERAKVTQATISHHLKELAGAELLERRKQGQFAYYKFRSETMEAYVGELERRLKLTR